MHLWDKKVNHLYAGERHEIWQLVKQGKSRSHHIPWSLPVWQPEHREPQHRSDHPLNLWDPSSLWSVVKLPQNTTLPNQHQHVHVSLMLPIIRIRYVHVWTKGKLHLGNLKQNSTPWAAKLNIPRNIGCFKPPHYHKTWWLLNQNQINLGKVYCIWF